MINNGVMDFNRCFQWDEAGLKIWLRHLITRPIETSFSVLYVLAGCVGVCPPRTLIRGDGSATIRSTCNQRQH
jgi:hypothetical protein